MKIILISLVILLCVGIVYTILCLFLNNPIYRINKFLDDRKKTIELRIIKSTTIQNIETYAVEERVHTLFGKRWKKMIDIHSTELAMRYLKEKEKSFYNRVKPNKKVIFHNTKNNFHTQ